jgi:hypothetical protein
MLLEAPRTSLRPADVPVPRPGPGQLLLRVRACGVCRTDLHVVDGELKKPRLPLILGHQIVGTVEDERFCFAIPEGYPDLQAAPLHCAGLIGWRSLRLAGEGKCLGLYGWPSRPGVPVRTQVMPYSLEAAGQALDNLRSGRVRGIGRAFYFRPLTPAPLPNGERGWPGLRAGATVTGSASGRVTISHGCERSGIHFRGASGGSTGRAAAPPCSGEDSRGIGLRGNIASRMAAL